MNSAFSKALGKYRWIYAVAALLMFVATTNAQQKAKPAPKFDGAAALNAAARQPMLAERVTETFALMGQKVMESRCADSLTIPSRNFKPA